MSGYLHFCKEQRASIAPLLASDPVSVRGQGTKILAEQWRALPESAKAVYHERHAADKVKYEQAIKEWDKQRWHQALVEKLPSTGAIPQ